MMEFEPGMLLAFRWDQDSYGVCKVLKVTETRKDPIISIVTYSNSFDSVPEQVDAEQLKPLVIHMPVIRSGIMRSDLKPVGTAEVKPEELGGYEHWLAAWKERRAGFFEGSIADSVDIIIEAMAQVDNGPQDRAMMERMRQQFGNKPPSW